jgi:L-asparaginase
MPQLKGAARLEVEEIIRVGSSSITVDDWLKLSTRINEILSHETDVKGVVVSHGSNTLEETAYFLNLTVRSQRPVVLTAAQRQFTTLSSDGPKNFLQAVRVAACDEACGKGVLVVANDVINAAREATKTISYRLETFSSKDIGVLGFVDDDQITFYRNPVKKHTLATPFVVRQIHSLPRVDIIYTYVGGDGTLIEAAVNHSKAKGLVVAGFPTGSPTPEMHTTLVQIVARGIPVVMTHRGGMGRVRPNTMITKDNDVYIWGDNLSAQKARILLSLSLTATKDRKEIQTLFKEF